MVLSLNLTMIIILQFLYIHIVIFLLQLANQTAELNCQSRCVQQGIKYMQLKPPLKVEIDAGEKGNE